MNTVEVLTMSKTAGELWNDLYLSISPKQLIWRVGESSTCRFRLLGPVLKATRIFLPRQYRTFVTYRALHKISCGEDKSFNVAYKLIEKRVEMLRAKSYKPPLSPGEYTIDSRLLDLPMGIDPPRPLHMPMGGQLTLSDCQNAKDFIIKVRQGGGWSQCVLSNAINIDNLMSPCVRMLVLTSNMLSNMIQEPAQETLNISGACASDLIVSRRGNGLATQYNTGLCEPYMLSSTHVKDILREGLIDVAKYVNENKHNPIGGFLYKGSSDYVLSDETDETINELIKVVNHLEEIKHIKSVEDNVNKIPSEAFENSIQVESPISLLNL